MSVINYFFSVSEVYLINFENNELAGIRDGRSVPTPINELVDVVGTVTGTLYSLIEKDISTLLVYCVVIPVYIPIEKWNMFLDQTVQSITYIISVLKFWFV